VTSIIWSSEIGGGVGYIICRAPFVVGEVWSGRGPRSRRRKCCESAAQFVRIGNRGFSYWLSRLGKKAGRGIMDDIPAHTCVSLAVVIRRRMVGGVGRNGVVRWGFWF
jgi:hypothetical protein